ncbi:GHMP family kinase ATP-binding protein, partial [Klebsiella pneumoniae]|uniref:GHMP family kinase ATP-binding protein n=1 Tax=Klebsiella pneumoniae TaxID=573 RepID=UPI003F522771
KLSRELDKGLFFRSDIPQGFGLGSSGALVAAIFLRYLDKAGDFKDELKHLTMDRIQNLKSYLGALEGYFHGKSSGIDPSSIIIN